MTPLYTTHAQATGGRTGKAHTADGRLNVELSHPVIQPRPATGTDPEQLFACAYAACYGGACEFAAKNLGFSLTSPAVVASDVTLLKREDGGFTVAVNLQVTLTGVSQQDAEKISEKAHTICPYSHATRGNIAVETVAVGVPATA